jgi:hypothetical protein
MSDIWFMLQDQDRYIYHYTSSSTLVNNILPDRQFLFSRFQNVNDPRESKDWMFNYHSITDSPGIDYQSIETILNTKLKHSWRVGCFVSDPYEALVTQEREDRGENIIMAGYERGHSHPRMWSQYGEDYRGACLVFDKEKLDAEIQALSKTNGYKVYAGKVEYRNPRIGIVIGKPNALTISLDAIKAMGFSNAIEAHILQHWKELFFIKARDWEQEREFRWVVSGNNNEDLYISIDSLVGIALGDRFPDDYKIVIGKFARSNPVSAATMHWKNGFPQPYPEHWRLLLEG